ncbi:MAG: trypsin-like peptidase domain-containing protein [Proteobacteria bacterium]|nr:trypsin-like peptidase domain-containing protein [Pseudomonadota bacterium]
MRRTPLYSGTGRTMVAPAPESAAARAGVAPAPSQQPPAEHPSAERSAAKHAPAEHAPAERSSTFIGRAARGLRSAGALALRHEGPLAIVVAAIVAAAIAWSYAASHPAPAPLSQDDIDHAVMHTIEHNVLPSQAARAYAAVRESVVRVMDFETTKDEGDVQTGVGSGVVIVNDGTILTNLHVVAGARRIGVVFADGTESDAEVIGTQPQNDLAVLKAKTIPDDLPAATLRSTADLAPGDEVVAVGFPFGIGPSASAGVISGLRRQFRSPEGKRLLTNLIQFDAAANPGNSGGPLVTMDGAVVGIVTGILNPTSQRVFVGIGFAVPIESAAAAVGMSPF